MGSRALRVHACGHDLPRRHARLEKVGQLLRALAFRFYEALEKHRSRLVVTNVQLLDIATPLLGHRKQVYQILPIELDHGAQDGVVEAAATNLRKSEDLIESPPRDPGLSGSAAHGVGLPCPGLTVGEQGDIVTIDGRLHEVLAVVINLGLGAWHEHGIEAELGPLHCHSHHVHLLTDVCISLVLLLLAEGPNTAEHTDRALQVLHHVMILLSLRFKLGQGSLCDSGFFRGFDCLTKARLDLSEGIDRGDVDVLEGVDELREFAKDPLLLFLLSDQLHALGILRGVKLCFFACGNGLFEAVNVTLVDHLRDELPRFQLGLLLGEDGPGLADLGFVHLGIQGLLDTELERGHIPRSHGLFQRQLGLLLGLSTLEEILISRDVVS
mmetsp:Transcript_73259/g.162072  ORF Transcript_73259/g.162072 Transcript_73259/m.162072 type:complete len:383 (+) Transcript_73259:577-1725(+)